ncbi:MAG TPA: NAD(P)-binding protein [Pseudonocardia sp.]|uniref:FAD-dependent oxidoreductase n=1 Tax=Pseudonocardia sp. TaxID=60912 RepID=UPI002ED9A691
MPQKAATVFAELSSTGTPSGAVTKLGTAVVLGGGIAGLLAARVLADHAVSVVIIERDETGDEARPGVPQGMQVHMLLPGGRAQIERWFPGFTVQAVAEGAVLSGTAELAAFSDNARHVRVEAGPHLLGSSRPFLESQIRRRTLALPNVAQVTGRATGLALDTAAVTGVHYLADDTAHTQPADLVVDAMGRASKLSDWLEQAGWQRPDLRRVTTKVNYATGRFVGNGKPVIATAIARFSPRSPTPGLAVAATSLVENNERMIMLAGYHNDRPERDVAKFRERCATVLPPVFAQAADGELIGEITTYHQADSRRRDYHLVTLPARLVSVGDAVASFNPVYGQGMSSAALHASCLSAYLQGAPDLTASAREFFDLQRVVVDAAWEVSTATDLARVRTTPPPPLTRIRRWLRTQVLTASVTDPVIAGRVSAVTYMLTHPATLNRWGTVLRAVAVNKRKRTEQRAAAGSPTATQPASTS